jgi:hypothetical protein
MMRGRGACAVFRETRRTPEGFAVPGKNQEVKVIMKKSVTWRVFTLITGMLLGLLAGLGFAAPASADTGSATVADGPDKDRRGDDGRGHYDDDDNRRDWDDDNGRDWDDGDNDDAELDIERIRNRAVEVTGENYEDDQRVTVYLFRNGHFVEKDRVWLDDDEEDFTVKFRDLRCGRYVAFTHSEEEGWVRSDDSVRICNRDRDGKH